MEHREVEWGSEKAVRNLAKHGVCFEDAAKVLGDPFGEIFHLEQFDSKHSDEEDRWITIGGRAPLNLNL